MKKSVMVMSVLSLFAHQAYAGEAAKQIESSIGAKVIKQAPSIAPGMTAILAEKDGKKRVFYESNDGKYLFYGMLYDQKGVNLTTLDVARLTGNAGAVTAPPQGTLDQGESIVGKGLLDQASKTHFIKEGSGQVVYVVFDPNCPYCKELYAKTRAGDVEIRWVPVGALTMPGGSSQQKVAEFFRSKRIDAIPSLNGVTPTQKENEMMQLNLEMLAASQANQVPLVLWQDSKSKEIHLIKGLPSDKKINQIFGKKG